MYKFEIHRNPNISKDGEFIDSYRYDEDSYVLERTINPVWSDLAFNWEKKDDRAFFRKNLDGSFMLTGSDYDWANGIRTDSIERNLYRILIIKELVDGIYTEVWRGFFSVIVGEWDFSKCVATFSDLIVWDEYSVYLENIEKEYNLIDVYPFTINVDSVEYRFDKKTESTFLAAYDESDPCNWSLPALTLDEMFSNDKYTLYRRTVSLDFLGTAWNINYEYRRDYVEQLNSPGVGWQDLGVVSPGGAGDDHKWVRNYLGYINPTYEDVETNVIGKDLGNGSAIICTYDRSILNVSDAPAIEDYSNDRARWFPAVVNYAFYGVTNPANPLINSSFFTLPTNPVTNEANEYNRMYVIQFSDIKETSDPATKAPYSVKDVEAWLRMLNVYWYVEESTGLVRFEHKKFFDQGLSYTGNSYGIKITDDSLASSQAKGLNKMSYNNKALPRIYELKMSYESGDDFFGTPIIYTGSMANWGEESKSAISVNNMATDVRGAILNDDAGNDGFFIIATQLIDGGVYAINGAGAWTGTTIYNKPLSVANIEDKLWKYKGMSAVGVMNGKYVEFESVENNLIQEGVKITNCGDFNPYKLVKTSYGDATVVSASLTLKDKTLILDLSYDV